MQDLQYRVCFRCKWEGETEEKNCPRCHEMLYTSGYIQASGVILTAIGAGLVIVMSVISLLVAYAIQQSGKPGGRFKYTGTRQDMIMIFAVFGVVMLFGLASLTEGLAIDLRPAKQGSGLYNTGLRSPIYYCRFFF